MAAVPPPPGRPRFGSSPDVWAALDELREDVAAIKLSIATQTAGVRHQTLQLLIGGVVACVTAVVGSRVVAPKPEATTTIVQTSAYDRALAACRELKDDEARGRCVAEALRVALGPPKP